MGTLDIEFGWYKERFVLRNIRLLREFHLVELSPIAKPSRSLTASTSLLLENFSSLAPD